MATEIPRVFLAGVSSSSAAAQTVNQKKWKHEQVRQALVLNNDHKCHYYMLNIIIIITWLNFSSSQAVLIFETVAVQFSNPDEWVKSCISQIRWCCSFDHVDVCVCLCVCSMSFQVLQGFTCSRIQSFSSSKVMNLIRGCKRRANQTLVLQESQVNKHTVAHKLLQTIAIQCSFIFCRTSWNLIKE